MRLALAFAGLALAATLTARAEPAPESPACALLTPDVATAWNRTVATTRDGGPPQSGMSNCSWTGEDYALLMVTLMDGETITQMGGPEKTFDGYLRSFNAGMKVTPEPLDGIGEKAVLLLEGDDQMRSAVLMILKDEKVVAISLSQTDRETAVAIGAAVAGNF